MPLYPYNLVLAVATACTAVFLGFLPTKNIQAAFFKSETFKLAVAWVVVAMTLPTSVLHFPIMIALLCMVAWRQFKPEGMLAAKMWLSIASGLGISVGVMLILAVFPQAYPIDLPESSRVLLLASIYLGGAVIGLAYFCFILTKNVSLVSGVTSTLVQRHATLLLVLVIARAGVLLSALLLPSHASGSTTDLQHEAWPLLAFIFVMMPTLAGMALRATQSRSAKAANLFLILCFAGFLAEILARLLVL